jgi:hypothetical protein
MLPVWNVRAIYPTGSRQLLIYKNRDQNPCHCKVIGPTIGFVVTVGMAVGLVRNQLPLTSLTLLRSSAGQRHCSAAVAPPMPERRKSVPSMRETTVDERQSTRFTGRHRKCHKQRDTYMTPHTEQSAGDNLSLRYTITHATRYFAPDNTFGFF